MPRPPNITESGGSEGDSPRSARANRTRQALVGAARKVFERDGFLDARITDISKAARVSHGTFYTYFRSKEEVFGEVVEELVSDMSTPPASPSDGPADRIRAAISHYLTAYQRNARLMATFEQASTISEDIRRMRAQSRSVFVSRTFRAIARWQAQGLADPSVDAHYAANALGNMVDRFAYVWLVLGDPYELERAVDTLTHLWINSLALVTDERALGEGPAAFRAGAD